MSSRPTLACMLLVCYSLYSGVFPELLFAGWWISSVGGKKMEMEGCCVKWSSRGINLYGGLGSRVEARRLRNRGTTPGGRIHSSKFETHNICPAHIKVLTYRPRLTSQSAKLSQPVARINQCGEGKLRLIENALEYK
jgi:hypothetical protein